ncbi:DNA repair protein rad13 [Penicillium chermesinum]|uniref:DNA repair protein rad13 n=1 Tax=Penicillium chermesinum TaxID=63820 RepID=A0A9W9NU32_9EURO|nr:DNA repair protein rad13 [Penicillium chermesinum]KAJ5226185.1 DNA repair protein rad13 [Penicillium chermesinum]
MGVTGLWTVLQPCARPIKLETLNKKRLAVDASIWIYQFLKAVRDKEGNALRNSHVVGFFRRICKLLYYGILPRREGRRDDAARTAGKLLALQMQRSAEEEAEARRQNRKRPQEEVSDTPIYVDDALMTQKERENRKFKKKDAYHLPNLDVSLEEMGAPNDPRIMSQEELEEYARQFHQGQDINLYDFSKIDFDSPFFISLPATDRYNILNAARLRSRLRMGYSKEQLDTMFPNRMAFSKFQIDRVKERNDLTQRLMNINGMNGEEAFYNSGKRIAGERGKEYVLVRDSEHEGGWVLGVVGNKYEGYEDKPIDVDRYGLQDELSGSDGLSEDDEFEDVPIEGVNRLPKLQFLENGVFDRSLLQAREDLDLQRALQESQQHEDEDALFVRDSNVPEQTKDLDDMFEDEDDELAKAIALSLEPNQGRDTEMPDVPINRQTHDTSHVESILDPTASDTDDDGMDFAAAVAQTKVSKKPETLNPYSGPLPFESISLKKVNKPHEGSSTLDDQAGGFLTESQPTEKKKKKKNEPLPPWFAGEQSKMDPVDPAPGYFAKDKDTGPEVKEIQPFTFGPRFPEIVDLDDASDTKSDTKEVIALDDDVEVQAETPAPSNKGVVQTQNMTKSDIEPPAPKALDAVTPHESHIEIPPPTIETPRPKEPEQVESSPEPQFEDEANEDHQIPQETFDQDFGEFSDPEDEDLMQQLAAEGEEHIRFAKTLNSAALDQSAFDYEAELKQLRNQQSKDRRDADEVTQIMINECQQLLRLFGLPYITAPMEAEAQCAELVSLGLVDGIVTDDSDTFLFGGTRVYKNMFNQSKYVECYLTSDFEKEFALHRRKLISFAHLLGSDYTEGVQGIGPVTALEIVTEFPDLQEFREWWTQVQMGVDIPDDSHAAFKKKFRKKASKIFLPPSFPDMRVEEAYLAPEVDSDTSPFKWGIPDMNGLRQFLMTTIGWSPERTDEILVPVIRDMNRRGQEGTQANITQFFQGPQGAGAFAPRARTGGPSRMEKAFGRLRNEAQQARDVSSRHDETVDALETTEQTQAAAPAKAKRSKSNKQGTSDGNKKRKTRATSEMSS